MSIQIEEGKFYRTRSGVKAGPIRSRPKGLITVWTAMVGTNDVCYAAAGKAWTLMGDGLDLIAEWADADEAPSPLNMPPAQAYEWPRDVAAPLMRDGDYPSKELYPFTEVAWTPEDGLTSRKVPLREALVENGESSFTEEADAPRTDNKIGWPMPTYSERKAAAVARAMDDAKRLTALGGTDAPPVAPYANVPPPEPMRVQILHEGARLTNGERDAEYGPPAINMAAAGALKAAFRAHMTRDISLAELEAIDMALTKLGRIATGQKVKRDTFIDCATYIAIAGEIALAENKG